MEYLKLLVALLEVIVWPAMTLFFIVTFRNQISKILSGNFKAKYKDYEITIESLRDAHIQKDIELENIEEQLKTQKDSLPIELLNEVEQSISNYKRVLTTDEEHILEILRKEGGEAKRTFILNEYFEIYDDPWHRDKYWKRKIELIESMAEKGLVTISGEDINICNIQPNKAN